jgi:hypothetical protein
MVVDYDMATSVSKSEGDGFADAATGAGDESDSIL